MSNLWGGTQGRQVFCGMTELAGKLRSSGPVPAQTVAQELCYFVLAP